MPSEELSLEAAGTATRGVVAERDALRHPASVEHLLCRGLSISIFTTVLHSSDNDTILLHDESREVGKNIEQCRVMQYVLRRLVC